MRALIIYASLALAACSSALPIPDSSQPMAAKVSTGAGFQAYGTLASVGSIEYELAPLLTRNAVLRASAAAAVRKHRLSYEGGKTVLGLTDLARVHIDAAIAEPDEKKRHGLIARASLAQAKAAEIINRGENRDPTASP